MRRIILIALSVLLFSCEKGEDPIFIDDSIYQSSNPEASFKGTGELALGAVDRISTSVPIFVTSISGLGDVEYSTKNSGAAGTGSLFVSNDDDNFSHTRYDIAGDAVDCGTWHFEFDLKVLDYSDPNGILIFIEGDGVEQRLDTIFPSDTLWNSYDISIPLTSLYISSSAHIRTGADFCVLLQTATEYYIDEIRNDWVWNSPYIFTYTNINANSSKNVYFTMPRGKDDYVWELYSGTGSLISFTQGEVVGGFYFSESGTKVVKGKYKEDGRWSYKGSKTVNVTIE